MSELQHYIHDRHNGNQYQKLVGLLVSPRSKFCGTRNKYGR